MDVVEVELFGLSFFFVVLSLVLLGKEIFLSKRSVTVESDLAVRCHNDTLLGQDERIDFDHVAVFVGETLVEFLE